MDLWKFIWAELVETYFKPQVDGPTIAGHLELGSGYDRTEDERMKAEELDNLCHELIADPALWAHDITGDGKPETFCSQAVRRAANRYGCSDFGAELDPITANMICDRLAGGLPGWRQDTGDRAAAHALKGGLAIAAKAYEPHGHVAVVAPRAMQHSGSWGKDVPVLANVGKPPNRFEKVSEAFPVAAGEPGFYLYEPA